MDRIFRKFFGFPPTREFPRHPGAPNSGEDDRHFGERPPHGEGFFFSGSFPSHGEPNFRFGFTPEGQWPPGGDGGDDDGGDGRRRPGGFDFSTTDPFGVMRQFDQLMTDMFRDFGSEGFSHPVPAIQPPPSSPGSLRDSMLKEPDSHSSSSSIQPQQQLQRPDAPVLILPPQHQTPTTLPDSPSDAEQSEDNKPSSSWFSRLFSWPKRDWTGAPPLKIEPGLGDGFLKELLPQERDEQPLDPEQRGEMSGYHGVSVYTFRGADGKVEERRTYHDSFGNAEETVTRGIGDQAHTVIIRRTPSGNEEKKEQFHNMQEDDKGRFEQDWESPPESLPGSRGRSPRSATPSESMTPSSSTPSMFKNLFSFHFPGFPKSDR